MQISSCESRIIQQNFKQDFERVVYVAPSTLICAFTDSGTLEYEFLRDLSDCKPPSCLVTQPDISIATTQIRDHSINAEGSHIRLQLLKSLTEGFSIVRKSEDISDVIKRLNSSLPFYEMVRLITASDNGANWYLTRSIESLVPLEEHGSLRATILSERNVLLTFKDLGIEIQAIDPLMLM